MNAQHLSSEINMSTIHYVLKCEVFAFRDRVFRKLPSYIRLTISGDIPKTPKSGHIPTTFEHFRSYWSFSDDRGLIGKSLKGRKLKEVYLSKSEDSAQNV